MKNRFYLLLYPMLLALAVGAFFTKQPQVYAQTVPPTFTVTDTPLPADTPTAALTPTVSATTKPTATSTPQLTPIKTSTVVPTATPTITPTPSPAATVVVQPNEPATLIFIDPGSELVSLQLPAGAVDKNITIQYTPLSSVTNIPSGFRFGNIAFTINAFDNNTLLPGFTFAKAVTLTIDYTDADIAGLDENRLVLRYFDPVSKQWLSDGITVINHNTIINRIILQLTHLTQFALFEGTIPTALDEGKEPMLNQKVFLPIMRG